MWARAPRRAARIWRGLARGACLAAVLGAGVPAARAEGATITEAVYTDPTTAYPHGVLGDKEEWSTLQLTVTREKGRTGGLFQGKLSLTYNIAALEDTVFEDIAPRLWDVTGDGKPEVVVVQSHQQHGARLVVIGWRDNALQYFGWTPYIGTRFRWLAPVGAVDLDGDGAIEVAMVVTPHLGKTLSIWSWRDDALRPMAEVPGLSNHKIGWDYIIGGVRDCGAAPELVMATGDWRNVAAVYVDEGRIVTDLRGPYEGRQSVEAALSC